MDIGATLAELIEGVQLEIGHSTNPQVGVNMRDHIASAIRREYRRLHADFAWPHLLSWQTVPVQAGEQFPALPVGITLPRIVKVYHKAPQTSWQALDRTLGVEDYNEVDSDADERRDPICKWRADADLDRIEVWPLPLTAGLLRIVAKSERLPLEADTDICDLDADLVILFASAVLQFKAGRQDAGVTLQRGRSHYDTLRQRLQTGAGRAKL